MLSWLLWFPWSWFSHLALWGPLSYHVCPLRIPTLSFSLFHLSQSSGEIKDLAISRLLLGRILLQSFAENRCHAFLPHLPGQSGMCLLGRHFCTVWSLSFIIFLNKCCRQKHFTEHLVFSVEPHNSLCAPLSSSLSPASTSAFQRLRHRSELTWEFHPSHSKSHF